MGEKQTTEPKYQIETHAGNPKMARVTNLNIKRLPECEGGGWYTDIETACVIADAMNRENGRISRKERINDKDEAQRKVEAHQAREHLNG